MLAERFTGTAERHLAFRAGRILIQYVLLWFYFEVVHLVISVVDDLYNLACIATYVDFKILSYKVHYQIELHVLPYCISYVLFSIINIATLHTNTNNTW